MADESDFLYETVDFTLTKATCTDIIVDNVSTPVHVNNEEDDSEDEGKSSYSEALDDDGDFIPFEEEEVSDKEETHEKNSEEGSPRVEKNESQPPWMDTSLNSFLVKSHFLRLHQEIINFCDFVAPTAADQDMRKSSVGRVTDVIKGVWPECEVKVFGSYATGLYLPTSDVDMVVMGANYRTPQEGLRAMSVALTRNKVATKMQVIAKARVPIIKFVELESNFCFDISLDMTNGPDAAALIRAAMEELPALRPLCLVLKIYLQQRELNEVYSGGLGSYALIIMIIAHLQLHSSWRSSSRAKSTLQGNLGILLVDFLELYGRTLNVYEVGVSCRFGGRFFSKRKHKPSMMDNGRPFLLSVEDPQAVDNDLCRNSYNISRVRAAFAHAHRLLTTPTSGDAEVGVLNRIIRMDSILLNRKKPKLIR